MSAYGASKAALELLTKAWAAEYGPAGVRVNARSPGPTRTPGTVVMGDGIDQLAATLPLGRAADAKEIANTIVFLASDDAGFVTGAILPVDGGRVARLTRSASASRGDRTGRVPPVANCAESVR